MLSISANSFSMKRVGDDSVVRGSRFKFKLSLTIKSILQLKDSQAIQANLSEKLRAAILFEPSVVDSLILVGANVNQINADGCTPLMLAIRFNVNLIELLINRGADVNLANFDKWTPLMVAVKYQPAVVDLLVRVGARFPETTDLHLLAITALENR